MNLFKHYNINEGFDFQGIADEFNNKQDELEKNNGLNTDLNKNTNIDLIFSSPEELIDYALDFAHKQNWWLTNYWNITTKNINYGLGYLNLYNYEKDPESEMYFFTKTFDIYRKVYNSPISKGDMGAGIFTVMIYHNKVSFTFNNINQSLIDILDKIFLHNNFEKGGSSVSFIKDGNAFIPELMCTSYSKEDFTDISVSFFNKILNIVCKEVNNKKAEYANKKVDEGFNFQGITDEFNNKQDELEKNNGLNTDTNYNDIENNLIFLNEEDVLNFIGKYLKENNIFKKIPAAEFEKFDFVKRLSNNKDYNIIKNNGYYTFYKYYDDSINFIEIIIDRHLNYFNEKYNYLITSVLNIYYDYAFEKIKFEFKDLPKNKVEILNLKFLEIKKDPKLKKICDIYDKKDSYTEVENDEYYKLGNETIWLFVDYKNVTLSTFKKLLDLLKEIF